MQAVLILRTPIARSELNQYSLGGELVKAVVDVNRGIMVIGGEMHSDEEQSLLEDGSQQRDLWGINLFFLETGPSWLEFDSMINLRPSQGNRSRGVEDTETRERIRAIVDVLVQ